MQVYALWNISKVGKVQQPCKMKLQTRMKGSWGFLCFFGKLWPQEDQNDSLEIAKEVLHEFFSLSLEPETAIQKGNFKKKMKFE